MPAASGGKLNLIDDKPVSPAFGLLIILAGVGGALTMTPLFPVLPAISDHFAHVPHAEPLVRGLITAVSMAFVVGAPIAGFMVERFDMRKVLLGAALLFTISGVSGFFIDNLWLLLMSRIVLGLSETTISTIVIALIAARMDPLRRNRWMGWFAVSAAVGSLIFIELSGIVASHGWRFIFLFYLGGLALFASALIAVKQSDGNQQRLQERVSHAGHFPAGAIAPLILVGLGIGAGAVENTTPIFLPFHLVEIGETSPSRIAGAILPIAAALATSAFFYGHVRRYLSIGSTFLVAFLGAGAALIALGLLRDYSVMLVASACLGLSIGVLAPNVYAYGAVFGSAEHQARNIGIARGAFFAGAPVMQLLLEPVSRSAGAGMALVTLGCASLLLMLWLSAGGRRMVGGRD